MKHIILAFILLTFSLPSLAAEKESAYDRVMRTGTLKCGYYPWPPYSEVDANTQKVTGLIPDIANAVGKLLDLKIEFVQMSANGMQVEELKKGVYDTFCVDSYYVFSMIKYADYSDPYFYTPVFAYVKADDKRFKTLDDMNKPETAFVGMDGDVSVTLVHQKFPKATLKSLPANSDATTMALNVMTGKADAAIMDPGLVDVFNKTNPPGLKIVAPDDPVAVYPIGFSVAKGEDKLLKMLSGAVSALNNIDSIEPLIKRYDLPENAVYKIPKPYKVSK